ncbi:MAG: hypothetical protein ACR2QE_15135 [Acidimicrobiales bacterium]
MAAISDPNIDRGAMPDLRRRSRALTVADATVRANYRTWRHLWSTVCGQRQREFHRKAMGLVDSTPMHTAHAAVDEMVLVFFEAMSDPMTAAEFVELEDQVDELVQFWHDTDVFDDPLSLHQAPTAPSLPIVVEEELGGRHGEWVHFESGWQPPEGAPGADRWMESHHNMTVPVQLLRHDDGPRPWLVLVHGAEMGRPRFDGRLLKAERLHQELGVNIAMPTLPLHGLRRSDGPTVRGTFPGENVIDNVYGLTQSVWDVRRTLAWIREQDATTIGLFGFSLGGGVGSLLGSVEPDLDALVLGCPAVDLVDLIARNQPPRSSGNARLSELLRQAALAHRPVSALHLDRVIDRDRVAIISAPADRLADPIDQVGRLWHHWAQPEIRWIDGGHVTYFMRRQSTETLVELLKARGVAA